MKPFIMPPEFGKPPRVIIGIYDKYYGVSVIRIDGDDAEIIARMEGISFVHGPDGTPVHTATFNAAILKPEHPGYAGHILDVEALKSVGFDVVYVST